MYGSRKTRSKARRTWIVVLIIRTSCFSAASSAFFARATGSLSSGWMSDTNLSNSPYRRSNTPTSLSKFLRMSATSRSISFR